MVAMLDTGAQLPAPVAGGSVRVLALLGEGGQGAVYEVRDVVTDERWALKWYHQHATADVQRAAIEQLVDRGAPSPAFLWPQALVRAPGDPGFGYLMPLRPDRYVGMADLMAGRADLPFSGVVTVGLELAHSFLLLHTQGLCYRDISFGNVFVDRTSGGVLICDCDNVGVDRQSPSMVLGTRRFMAPEIVRGEAGPSRETDLYSLAVLLFYLFMVGHPLVGRRELDYPAHDVQRAELDLFGRSPLFVFDPDDDSNLPVPELHGSVADNWRLYPQEIRALFVQSFTVGLRDPRRGRVQESVWRRVLGRLLDSVGGCSACGAENFFPPSGGPDSCWDCGRRPDQPLRLLFDDSVVVLTEDKRVCAHHVRRDYDRATVVATVTRHPQRRDRWGLRNESPVEWGVDVPGGRSIVVPPGSVVGLVPGARYDLGGRVATLHQGALADVHAGFGSGGSVDRVPGR